MNIGFKKLDEVIDIKKGQLILLGGRQVMGKSTLLLNIATNVAFQDTPTALFSIESSKKRVIDRILASESLVDIKKVILEKDLIDNDWNKLANTMKKISDLKLYIDDTPGISIQEISNKCRRLKQERNIELVVIDYLQLIEGNESAEKIKKLKELAKELNITIIVAYMLPSNVDRRENKKPLLADVRNNELIDIVILLYRDYYYKTRIQPKDNKVEIIIAKNEGKDTEKVEMYFDEKYQKLYEKDENK